MRAWPTSPSFEFFSSDGTTTVSSCRMIEAVMYGMIPSANSAIRDRPPPLNVFSRLRIPPPPESVVDDLARAAGGLDGLPRGRAELVRVDGQRLRDLALGEHLDRDALLR